MPFEPLKNEDLALVNRLMQAHPDLQDTIAVVKQVNAKGKYPIDNFDELAKTMGGEHASITFRGRTLTMADARNVIPAYYFPIHSEADLLAKMADLSKSMPPATAALKTPPLEHSIKLMEATAVKPEHISPPHMNVEEIFKTASFGKQTPGVGGVK
ncbi:hypothetical protein [Acidipila rosea]|uniref:Uncharacterized protein n=1 Tax=Acidipila rosea TaxID=768535 RepID=A0A4R1LC86_9BACT|nr:hypothetical protein [Acidipila rosea]TCK75050.1 hypothetical protein C7378_0029 [Acidipila rosea]